MEVYQCLLYLGKSYCLEPVVQYSDSCFLSGKIMWPLSVFTVELIRNEVDQRQRGYFPKVIHFKISHFCFP